MVPFFRLLVELVPLTLRRDAGAAMPPKFSTQACGEVFAGPMDNFLRGQRPKQLPPKPVLAELPPDLEPEPESLGVLVPLLCELELFGRTPAAPVDKKTVDEKQTVRFARALRGLNTLIFKLNMVCMIFSTMHIEYLMLC